MTEPSLPEESILHQALEIASPALRAVFLDRACGENRHLRAEVEALLHAHAQSGDLLDLPEKPAVTVNEPVREGPGTVIGPYKLLQQIGEGGMGTVFMAEQAQPVQRKVALKVIKAGMDSRQVIARFEAERQALALMDHVNIARVLDAGATKSGRPYFVMELVHGVPITTYCNDNHLTPRERLELFVPVCQAIQHAHQKGIIHRDIKPSNVMITLYDGKPVPKVIDFGVAKATERRLTERTLFTQYGTIVGTFEYVSPEQAEMSALGVDTRSDIYSLGVLLYELLTGSTPLTQKRIKEAAYGEILRMIREEEPPKPSTRLSDSGEALASISAQRHTEPAKLSKMMRGELDWIVMKTLEKDRNRRYETANLFAADVLHYLHDESVVACPPSARYRLRKFARRNRAAFWTTGVVALALVIGTVVSAWQAVRATQAERLADSRLETEKNARSETETARTAEAAQRAIAEQRREEAEQQSAQAEQQRQQAKEQELLARRRYYAAQMNLAQQAWDQEHPARVLELLESQRPKFDQPDPRTFEWYYLWRRCHADCRLSLHLGHPPEFSSVALAPDGKTLAAQYGKSDIKLWDLTSGRERLVLKGRERTVYSLAFAADGQTLASGSSGPGDLILWDVSSGRAKRILESGQLEVRSLAFAADGKTLASGGGDGTIKVWNLATWGEENSLHGHAAGVLCVTFSPDGKTLASASAWGKEGGVVNLWDLNAKPVKSRRRLSGSATVAFSPDGKTLASGRFNPPGDVRLFDVETGQRKVVHNTNSGGITCIAYAPDGRTLAIGSADRTVKLWEPETNRERSYAHHDGVQWVAFSPDGKTVASASLSTVKLWEVIAATEPAILQNGGDVRALAFSPDGHLLATGGEYSTKLWDVATGQKAATLPHGHHDYFGSVAFSHDGKTLAIAAAKMVKLIAVVNRRQQGAVRVDTSNVGSLALNLNANTDHLLAMVKSLTFSPDDKTLAVAGDNVTAILFDLAARQVRATLDGTSVAFAPDQKTLATGGMAGRGDGSVTLWDAGTFKERITCRGDRNSWVFDVQFSPDGKLVAQTTDYGTILVWDVASGALHASLKGHTSPVNCVAFHPDSNTLASASADKTIKLWDVSTGQERLTLTGHTKEVRFVAFAPDGNTLASGSADGTVKLWRAALNREAAAPRTCTVDLPSVIMKKHASPSSKNTFP
jgi:eukaryotic-like serine/threonine-protein kinase